MTPCETLISGIGPCGEPATSTVAAGCMHEHIETGPICRRHLELLEGQSLHCPACWRASEPHHCLMLGRVTA